MSDTPRTDDRPDAGVLIRDAVASHRRRVGTTTASGLQERSAPGPRAAVQPGGAPAARHVSDTSGPLAAGVLLPALAIVVEVATGICARTFFDPIPTTAHLALVAAVPAANLVAVVGLARGWPAHPLAIGLLGAGTVVAGLYALVFLPMLPLALIGLLAVIGLLPLAPLAGLCAALLLRRRLARQAGPAFASFGALFASGLAVGLVAMVAVEAPAIVTRHGLALATSHEAGERQRGVELLRRWGSRDLLLAWSYDTSRNPAGLVGSLVDGVLRWPQGHQFIPAARVREVYWQVTGEPFNARPAPRPLARPASRAGVAFDRDLGGQAVGGLAPGLALVESRIDGTIAPDDAVAYMEWTLEVENATAALQEARLSLALPPGAVVSRVTLWVNGVEEEAAYAGRGAVRAAYERVVRRAQDPFLVTTKGGDRVLAQAFPVPANGGRMRFKVGITAPLELDSLAAGRLALPVVAERNFAVPETTRHHVWLESRGALAASHSGLAAASLDGGRGRIVGTLSDAGLVRARPIIEVARRPEARIAVGGSAETGLAMQEIAATPAPADTTLMLVIDGSGAIGRHRTALVAALARPDAFPTGFPVGLAVADGRGAVLAPAPWSAEQSQRLVALVEASRFEGGADNAPALAAALAAVGDRAGSRIVWLHGPQPVDVGGGRVALEQAAARISRVPALSLLALEPGPVSALPDVAWAWGARDVVPTGDVAGDLARLFDRASGRAVAPSVTRRMAAEPSFEHPAPVAEGTVAGSSHIARLAARDEVLAIMRREPVHGRSTATDLAQRHRLVTPVSGAVVLETQRQYVEAGLQHTKLGKGTVPTVPEPEVWALLVVALLALGWLITMRRESLA